jgi:hypothetical protein
MITPRSSRIASRLAQVTRQSLTLLAFVATLVGMVGCKHPH